MKREYTTENNNEYRHNKLLCQHAFYSIRKLHLPY